MSIARSRRASDEYAARLARSASFGEEQLVHLGLLTVLDELIDEGIARGELERALVDGEPGFRKRVEAASS